MIICKGMDSIHIKYALFPIALICAAFGIGLPEELQIRRKPEPMITGQLCDTLTLDYANHGSLVK